MPPGTPATRLGGNDGHVGRLPFTGLERRPARGRGAGRRCRPAGCSLPAALHRLGRPGRRGRRCKGATGLAVFDDPAVGVVPDARGARLPLRPDVYPKGRPEKGSIGSAGSSDGTSASSVSGYDPCSFCQCRSARICSSAPRAAIAASRAAVGTSTFAWSQRTRGYFLRDTHRRLDSYSRSPFGSKPRSRVAPRSPRVVGPRPPECRRVRLRRVPPSPPSPAGGARDATALAPQG